MKPGDKVWWFDNYEQTIKRETIVKLGEISGIVHTTFHIFHIGTQAFPTREALCEHYRKIFE